MSSYIKPAVWARYKKVMRNAHDTFSKAVLIWMRYQDVVLRHREELPNNHIPIELNVLMGYNTFRTWPISLHENPGELDNQNMIAIINRQYLEEGGYLTPQGYLNFRPDEDYFIHMGLKYKAEGDTAAAQMQVDPVHIIVVLRREELKTGEKPFSSTPTENSIITPEVPLGYLKTYSPEMI